MKKSDLIAIAWQNLKNRKTRTILTICGVVVGACAIIIMLSIGLGIDKMITAQYKSDSSLNKISVYSMDSEDGTQSLPFDDTAVKYFEGIDGVKCVVPMLMVDSNVAINCGKYSYTGTVYGMDLSQMEALGYKLAEGDFSGVDKPNCAFFGKDSVTNFQDAQGNQVNFTYDKNYEVDSCDIDAMKNTFLISSKASSSDDSGTATDKFGNKQKLYVSGVLKSASSMDYNSQYSVFISMDLAKRLFQESQMLNPGKKEKMTYSSINVYVEDSSKVNDVKKTLQDVGYSCSTDDEALESSKKVMKVVQLVLGAIGAVSMFVASFGISNTMVMSVFERQKEIGILKVIGCEIKDIKAMFLYEAAIIGGIGGAVGVTISYIISTAANLIGRVVMNHMGGGSFLGMGADVKVTLSYIPPWLAICGVVFSAGIGILAGLSPARKSVKVSALTAIQN